MHFYIAFVIFLFPFFYRPVKRSLRYPSSYSVVILQASYNKIMGSLMSFSMTCSAIGRSRDISVVRVQTWRTTKMWRKKRSLKIWWLPNIKWLEKLLIVSFWLLVYYPNGDQKVFFPRFHKMKFYQCGPYGAKAAKMPCGFSEMLLLKSTY